MNKNIIIIMDRSGSMKDMGDEPVEALNIFLEDQIKNNKKGKLSLLLFNNKVTKIFINETIETLDKDLINYEPKGMTALYDAIGEGISKYIERGDKNYVVVIITDGFENSSQNFTKKQITDIIKKSENELDWSFIYLGANQDSFEIGGSLGIKSCSNFDSNTPGSLSKVIRYTSESITTPLKPLPLKRFRNSL